MIGCVMLTTGVGFMASGVINGILWHSAVGGLLLGITYCIARN